MHALRTLAELSRQASPLARHYPNLYASHTTPSRLTSGLCSTPYRVLGVLFSLGRRATHHFGAHREGLKSRFLLHLHPTLLLLVNHLAAQANLYPRQSTTLRLSFDEELV